MNIGVIGLGYVGSAITGGMEKYFKYRVYTECGIPEVKLLGQKSDWEKLHNNVLELIEWNKKNKVGLDKWLDSLEPFVKELYHTAEGYKNMKFWKNIYKQEGGSGGDRVTGEILKLYPKL